uniref:Uncharacterized protein n=1 Tax=Glossina pallidipes TaxID=7398 RepID=A0A1B0AHZ7_GLOPL
MYIKIALLLLTEPALPDHSHSNIPGVIIQNALVTHFPALRSPRNQKYKCDFSCSYYDLDPPSLMVLANPGVVCILTLVASNGAKAMSAKNSAEAEAAKYNVVRRHLTKSKGTTNVCVVPHDKMPPILHRAKYLELPNSQDSVAAAAA